MNAPAQGTIPWFYNRVLPLGEASTKDLVTVAYHESQRLARGDR